MSSEDLKTSLIAQLTIEPKPVTPARLQEIANEVLDGIELVGFLKWFEINGTAFLRRINGG